MFTALPLGTPMEYAMTEPQQGRYIVPIFQKHPL